MWSLMLLDPNWALPPKLRVILDGVILQDDAIDDMKLCIGMMVIILMKKMRWG